MFLRVEKISERKKKEVDAKHLLFYMWWGDCEAVLTPIKGGWLCVVKVAMMPSFYDEIR